MNNPKTPTEFVVELAVAALDGNPNPLDMDMKGIGESPSDLDLTLPGKPKNRPAAAPADFAPGGDCSPTRP
jgi:hypothetical protein